MEPCSILELTSTVLKLSSELCKFFKAVHDAPVELSEYLEALENTTKVFVDVEHYVQVHEQSAFSKVDRVKLDTLTTVLKECSLSFRSQVSTLETYQMKDITSSFQRMRTKAKWVFGRDAIKSSAVRLQESQELLTQALSISVGNNTVFIRNAVGLLATDIEDVRFALLKEERQRQEIMRMMSSYSRGLESGIATLLGIANQTGIQSTVRLEDMATSVATEYDSLNMKDDRDGPEISPSKHDNPITSQPQDTAPLESETSSTNSSASYMPGDSRVPEDAISDIKSETKQMSIPTTAESSHATMVWDQALSKFLAQLSPREREWFEQYQANGGFRSGFQALEASDTADRESSMMKRLYGVFDVFIQASPGAASLLWGAAFVTAEVNLVVYDNILTGFEEISDAMEICKRESQLYRHRRIVELSGEAYVHILGYIRLCAKAFSHKKLNIATYSLANRREFSEKLESIRRVSQRLLREVDFQHRIEMREASRKIADMYIQQHRIAEMLRHQKIILESLQQERQIMDVVREQQKILQVMRQIQHRLQLEDMENSIVGEARTVSLEEDNASK